jgi:two-component system NarL family sensor kinase
MPSIVQVQQAGLVRALRSHVQGMGQDGLRIELDATAYTPQPAALEETLFRVAQESLNNIVKHAKATNVQLQLTTTDAFARLLVRDDGIGFNPPDAQHKTGIGLQSMRERSEAQGGELRIVSAPGQGASVAITLPLGKR